MSTSNHGPHNSLNILFTPAPSSSTIADVILPPNPPSTPIHIIRKTQSAANLPTDASTSSSARITFAPLPTVERTHRSSSQMKLGVAARSNMMRQRRAALENASNPDRGQPQDGERALQTLRSQIQPTSGALWDDQAKAHAKGKGANSRPTDPDDPLVAVGRMVKNAWRAFSTPSRIPPASSTKASFTIDDCEESDDEMPEVGEAELERQIWYSQEHTGMSPVAEEENVSPLGDAIARNTFKPIRTSSAPNDIGYRTRATTAGPIAY